MYIEICINNGDILKCVKHSRVGGKNHTKTLKKITNTKTNC